MFVARVDWRGVVEVADANNRFSIFTIVQPLVYLSSEGVAWNLHEFTIQAIIAVSSLTNWMISLRVLVLALLYCWPESSQ